MPWWFLINPSSINGINNLKSIIYISNWFVTFNVELIMAEGFLHNLDIWCYWHKDSLRKWKKHVINSSVWQIKQTICACTTGQHLKLISTSKMITSSFKWTYLIIFGFRYYPSADIKPIGREPNRWDVYIFPIMDQNLQIQTSTRHRLITTSHFTRFSQLLPVFSKL